VSRSSDVLLLSVSEFPGSIGISNVTPGPRTSRKRELSDSDLSIDGDSACAGISFDNSEPYSCIIILELSSPIFSST